MTFEMRVSWWTFGTSEDCTVWTLPADITQRVFRLSCLVVHFRSFEVSLPAESGAEWCCGTAGEWLVDQPRLVVDMLYRLQNLKTPTGADRSALIKEEAQELLLLISFESLLDPRILCRCASLSELLGSLGMVSRIEKILLYYRDCVLCCVMQNCAAGH